MEGELDSKSERLGWNTTFALINSEALGMFLTFSLNSWIKLFFVMKEMAVPASWAHCVN